MIGIYLVKNKINGKLYVGQSVQIEERWKDEIQESLRKEHPSNSKFIRALRKYGSDNFEFSILEECSIEKLNERETFYIKKFNSTVTGYNIQLGGDSRRKVDYDLFKTTVENNPDISNIELAKIFKIVPDTALRIRKRLGLNRKTYKYEYLMRDINLKKDDIIKLFNDRLSIAYIAKQLNLNVDLLIEALKNWKVSRKHHYNGEGNKQIILYNKSSLLFENIMLKGDFERKYGYGTSSLKNKSATNRGFILRYFKDDFPKKLKKFNDGSFEFWD